jgi:hypothetical protein
VPDPPATMMPLRDMRRVPLSGQDHRLRDLSGLLRPRAAAEAKGLFELAAVEFAIAAAVRRSRMRDDLIRPLQP